MNYSAAGVPTLAGYFKLALGVGVKRNVKLDKLAYVFGPFGNQHAYCFGIAKSRSRIECVLNVRFNVVSRCNYGGNATLCKPRITVLNIYLGNDNAFLFGGNVKTCIKTCNSASHDKNVAVYYLHILC